MPGNHSGIVEPMGGFKDPYLLVKDMAARFLMRGNHRQYGESNSKWKGHTAFKTHKLLSRASILRQYSRIRLNFKEIRHEARWGQNSNKYDSQIWGKKRKILTQNTKGSAHATIPRLTRNLKNYFVNNHHAEVMRQLYPALAACLNSLKNHQITSHGVKANISQIKDNTNISDVYDDIQNYLLHEVSIDIDDL